MRSIIAFALKNRLLILALTALLVGWGIWSMVRLPIDAVPDVTNVQVQINTNAPALSPLEVERQITLPVELAMFGAGVLLYARATKPRDRAGGAGFLAFVGLLHAVYAVAAFGPPPSAAAVAWSDMAQWLVILWAMWIDRHRSFSAA